MLDLHNKEIIGYSAGDKKDADLVYEAFLSCSCPLTEIKIFHTDKGNEFKNKLMDYINWYNNHRSRLFNSKGV